MCVARRFVVASVVVCGSLFGLVYATEDPVTPPPEVETLVVTKDTGTGEVVLDWTDGQSPFAVERNKSPDFLDPVDLTYVTRSTTGGRVRDPVLNDGINYFYLVSDANSPTEVYEITHANPVAYEGDLLTTDGVGFASSCADNAVYLEGGLAAPLNTCSTTRIEAEVPAHAVSGSVVVVAPNGTSTATTRLFAVGVASNPAKDELAHLNVDDNHNIFACDQASSDRIWKIDFATGSASTCVTFGNPAGLPKNENGNFNYGNDTWSDFNSGQVREMDPDDCSSTSWGSSGTASTDPVDPRALAYDKSGGNDGWTFVLDHRGDRIRRKGNGPGLDTGWLTGLGLGGNTAAASQPAGFTFNTAGEFFFTAQSTIQHYRADRTLIQSFTSSDGLEHPAQIEVDEGDTLWVANRDGGNVLRFRTDPANLLTREKISGLSSPRGLALDRDPSTNDPWIYVADQHEIYRFRVYDTVHVDIKVLNETLTSPTSGTVISQAEFERRVRRDFAQARAILTQCGIEVVVGRVIFIPDPNSNDGAVEAVTSCQPLPTTEEQNVLGASRSAGNLDINVYYINHFVVGGIPIGRNGESFTNDCYTSLNNQTGGGVMLARFSGNPLRGGAIDNTGAHELIHFLLDNFVQAGFTGEHRGAGCGAGDADSFFIMHGTGCSRRYLLSAAECTDILTNSDESEFVELF